MTTDVAALAKKIDRLLEKSEEPYAFDADEVKDLQRVLVFVKRVDALGWWGKWIIYATVTGGAVLINWDRLVEFFKG